MNKQELDEKRKRIDEVMAQCIGTINYYRMPSVFCPKMVYTDGVKAFADTGSCWWFVSDTAIMFSQMPRKESFYSVTLTMKDGQGDLVIKGDKETKTEHVDISDMPDGEWVFFIEYDGNGFVLLYCTEH